MTDWKCIQTIGLLCALATPVGAENARTWWERDIRAEAAILAVTNAQIQAVIADELARLDHGQRALGRRAAEIDAQLQAAMPQIEAEIRAMLASLEGPTRPEIVYAIRADVAREQLSSPNGRNPSGEVRIPR